MPTIFSFSLFELNCSILVNVFIYCELIIFSSQYGLVHLDISSCNINPLPWVGRSEGIVITSTCLPVCLSAKTQFRQQCRQTNFFEQIIKEFYIQCHCYPLPNFIRKPQPCLDNLGKVIIAKGNCLKYLAKLS